MLIEQHYMNNYISHHGVTGQKWGVRHGPPYPLSSRISTGSALKTGGIGRGGSPSKRKRKKKSIFSDMSEKDRKNLKRSVAIGGGYAGLGAGIAAYGLHRLAKSRATPRFIDSTAKRIGGQTAARIGAKTTALATRKGGTALSKGAKALSYASKLNHITKDRRPLQALGAAAAIGGVAAAGYGAKKLYDKYKAKKNGSNAVKTGSANAVDDEKKRKRRNRALKAAAAAAAFGLGAYGVSRLAKSRSAAKFAKIATERLGRQTAANLVNSTPKRIGAKTAALAIRPSSAVGAARNVTTGLNEIRRNRKPLEAAAAIGGAAAAGYGAKKLIDRHKAKKKKKNR